MDNKTSFKKIFAGFFLLIIFGIIGYMKFLNVNFIEALYMTVITVSTVGYKEVAEMNNSAKLFSIIIIIFSLGFAGYIFTNIVTFFAEGEIKKAWRIRKMGSRISSIKDHYIICGAGETGETIIERFVNSKVDFVVIDNDTKRVETLTEKSILAISGDASDEEILVEAGIKRAKGLISALSSDAENVYVVLTARYLNKDLHIVSRAIEKHSDEKLLKAGANNTISRNEIEGRRMATMMLNPSIISFLDIITHVGDYSLDLDEVIVNEDSEMVGKSLKEIRIPERTGLIVLAIKNILTKNMSFNPGSDEIIKIDDSLVVLGKEEQIKLLKDIAKDKGDRNFSL